MNNLITDKMRETASEISSLLISASVSYKMNGLGGSLTWEQFKERHSNNKYFPYIVSYSEGELTANEIIFLVMYSEM